MPYRYPNTIFTTILATLVSRYAAGAHPDSLLLPHSMGSGRSAALRIAVAGQPGQAAEDHGEDHHGQEGPDDGPEHAAVANISSAPNRQAALP